MYKIEIEKGTTDKEKLNECIEQIKLAYGVAKITVMFE